MIKRTDAEVIFMVILMGNGINKSIKNYRIL